MKKSLLKIPALALVALLALSGVAFAGPDSDADSDSDSNGRSSSNLVEVAIAVNTSGPFAGQFDSLIAAVLAADPVIVETLTARGQRTVFAPTDAAFAELGLNPMNIGTVDQAALTQILTYHVARGRRDSEDVLESRRIRTLQGSFLQQSDGVLTDTQGRQSNIIVTDVEASNGIIHAIDRVVLPFAL